MSQEETVSATEDEVETDVYSDRRRRIYSSCFGEYRAQYINYEKHYLASDVLKNAHKAISIYNALVGAFLLVVIGWVVRSQAPTWITPVSLVLSASVTAASILSVIVDWNERAETYYREGQLHQDLYKKFNHLVRVRLPDPNEDDAELEERYLELVDQKNELNRETSQLASRWFKLLKWREDLDWNQIPLEKLR